MTFLLNQQRLHLPPAALPQALGNQSWMFLCNSRSTASHAPASTDHATSSQHSQHLTGTTEQHKAEKEKQDDDQQ
ncbi:17937_t:CDS:2, partial [Gigaspora rosea]